VGVQVALQVVDGSVQAGWLQVGQRDALSGQAIAALGSDQLADALNFAARAAAITCSRRGADLPRRAELS
jgi:fructokinase